MRGGRYTTGDMIVLGITETHCATAAVLRGRARHRLRLRGALQPAQERRRLSAPGDRRPPARARRSRPQQIDLVALAGARAASPRVAEPGAARRGLRARVLRRARGRRGAAPSRRRVRKLGRQVRAHRRRPAASSASRSASGSASSPSTWASATDRIVCLDHHTCHAAAAYWGSGFAGRDALVLTNDNSGDGLCATASTGRGARARRATRRRRARRARWAPSTRS